MYFLKNFNHGYRLVTLKKHSLWLLPFFNDFGYFRANIYLFKVNNRNTRKRCEIYSKLTIKTKRRQCRRSCVFIDNTEHISHLFLVFLLVNLNKLMLAG